MRKCYPFRLVALLSPAALGGVACAQTPAGIVADCQAAGCSATWTQTVDGTISSEPGMDNAGVYSPALNGAGAISLLTALPGSFTFGAAVSGGYDTNPNNGNAALPSGFITVSPYLALKLSTPRTQNLLQYTLSDTTYNASYSSQVFHEASFRHLHSFSDRWSLDFDALGSYGQNNARFLGTQQSIIAGDVQGAAASDVSYLANAGNVINASAALGATYLLSPTGSLHLQITDGLTRFADYPGTNSVATETVSFARELSPHLEWSLYTQGTHYYGSVRCDSFGGGVAVQWSPSEKTTIKAGGGPQLDAPNCGAQQGASYSFAITHRLNGRSDLYVLTKREPGTSYLGPGLWQDSASTGYSHLIGKTGQVRVNFAYVHSLDLTGRGSYDPIYLDGGYEHDLGRKLQASFTYRAYTDLSGGNSGSRNVAMFSLTWSPDRTTSVGR